MCGTFQVALLAFSSNDININMRHVAPCMLSIEEKPETYLRKPTHYSRSQKVGTSVPPAPTKQPEQTSFNHPISMLQVFCFYFIGFRTANGVQHIPGPRVPEPHMRRNRRKALFESLGGLEEQDGKMLKVSVLAATLWVLAWGSQVVGLLLQGHSQNGPLISGNSHM